MTALSKTFKALRKEESSDTKWNPKRENTNRGSDRGIISQIEACEGKGGTKNEGKSSKEKPTGTVCPKLSGESECYNTKDPKCSRSWCFGGLRIEGAFVGNRNVQMATRGNEWEKGHGTGVLSFYGDTRGGGRRASTGVCGRKDRKAHNQHEHQKLSSRTSRS